MLTIFGMEGSQAAGTAEKRTGMGPPRKNAKRGVALQEPAWARQQKSGVRTGSAYELAAPLDERPRESGSPYLQMRWISARPPMMPPECP